MNEKSWNRLAPIYNSFMKKDKMVYEQMYKFIGKTVKDKNVLELATGTGKGIVRNS